MKIGYQVKSVFLPKIRTAEEYNKAYEEAKPTYFERLSDAKEFAGSLYGWYKIGDHAYCGRIGYWEYSIERVRIDNKPAADVVWHKDLM